MQTLALGIEPLRHPSPMPRSGGFTLLELLVVVAIMALATAGVGFAIRDGAAGDLDREAIRLAALLDSARAQSRMSGSPVRWRTTPTGFVFEGLPTADLPTRWLSQDTRVSSLGGTSRAGLTLGPEPIIGAQSITLTTSSHPDRNLTVSTDGVRPFTVLAVVDPALAGR